MGHRPSTKDKAMATHVLAIDQGTTSTRTLVFDETPRPVAFSQQELSQSYPQPGWVEHDPEEIWQSAIGTARAAMAKAGLEAKDIAALGITNQRETALVWDRGTGKPIHPAIVWQDRRTAGACQELKKQGLEPQVTALSGLLIDPYFSASKAAWILDRVPGARERAQAGELAFGTVDSFLLWRLTGGRVHATEATNACRTLLFDLDRGCWSDDLRRIFEIPESLLPVVHDCAHDFGWTEPDLLGGAIRIAGIAGDQQAATIGQACFAPGMLKATYGTGCFALLNIGAEPIRSKNRLLTTVAYQLAGKRTYALEGSIFVAGAVVQWLRDGLGIIAAAAQSGELAAHRRSRAGRLSRAGIHRAGRAALGPGLPRRDLRPDARQRPSELARAGLEAVCYQTHDLLAAMRADWQGPGHLLRADGGLSASDWTMQRLADILGLPVDRPQVIETTALGAAYLAGLQAGVYPPPQDFAKRWAAERRFEPAMEASVRSRKLAGWSDAVGRTLSK
jgi:glycerol kinase